MTLESELVDKEVVEEKPESDEEKPEERRKRDHRLAWASEMMTCRHIEEKVLGMAIDFIR